MGDPDLVGTDWVKLDPQSKGACSLRWGVCLFITCRCPNHLIKWSEPLHGGRAGPRLKLGMGVGMAHGTVFG